MVLKYEANLLNESTALKSILRKALPSEVVILDDQPLASNHDGCFIRIANVIETGGFVELYLDHHAGYASPMYWCGITFIGDYGWNYTLDRLTQAYQVRLGVDPEGKADIGETPESDGITDYNEDFPPDYRTYIEVMPPRFLDCSVTYAFPQDGQFYLGCYFTDYSAENAAAYLQGLCGHANEPAAFREGAVTQRMTNVYERNPQARLRRINSPGGLDCCVCGINFAERYGDVGQGFIHVHHTLPVSDRAGGSMTSEGELVSVCPNCHAMLHRNGLRSPDELRAIMEAALLRNPVS